MFAGLRQERHTVIVEQRKAFGRVAKEIIREFGDWIRVHRVDNGDSGPLKRFLETFRQKGITRLWNGLASDRKPSPDALIANFKSRTLDKVGMSALKKLHGRHQVIVATHNANVVVNGDADMVI